MVNTKAYREESQKDIKHDKKPKGDIFFHVLTVVTVIFYYSASEV
jgi:hypothetical protein